MKDEKGKNKKDGAKNSSTELKIEEEMPDSEAAEEIRTSESGDSTGAGDASGEFEDGSGKGTVTVSKKKRRGVSISRKKLIDEIETLQEQNELLQREIIDLKDVELRLRAECDNFRKRTVRERSELIRSASARVLGNFLDIIDDFDRALPEGNPDDPFRRGIVLLYSRFVDLLVKEGLEEIEALGEKFDPAFHEAVFQVESSEHEPDTIASVFKKGYRINDRVFRPAAVGVYKIPEPVVDDAEQSGQATEVSGPCEESAEKQE